MNHPEDTQRELEACHIACERLIITRRRILIIAILSWVILLLIFALTTFGKPKRNHSLPSTAPTSMPNPVMIEHNLVECPQSGPSKTEAEAYIDKVRNLLDGNDKAKADTAVTISSPALEDDKSLLSCSPDKTDPAHKDIADFIYRWSLAWELKKTTEYFSYYSKDFSPGWKAKDFEAWRQRREPHILKYDWIKIHIDDLRIKNLTEDSATAIFQQDFESPGYSDQTVKRLQLAKIDGQWRIMAEAGMISLKNFEVER